MKVFLRKTVSCERDHFVVDRTIINSNTFVKILIFFTIFLFIYSLSLALSLSLSFSLVLCLKLLLNHSLGV